LTGTTTAKTQERSAARGREVWKLLSDERYAVSNFGRCASRAQGDNWSFLAGSEISSGYITFNLPREAGGTVLAHRTVVLSFDGPPPTDQHTDVRHLDGDKSNNRLDNLLWGTRSENMLDVRRHKAETKRSAVKTEILRAKAKGTWFGGRTWDERLVQSVLRLEAEKRITLEEAAELLDVSRHTVQNLVLGRTRDYVNLPKRNKQKRRSYERKQEILSLVREGKNAKEINELLGETLTPQAVYYYKSRA